MPKIIDAQRLFVVTVQVFGDVGFRSMTMSEIARRAGTNEVTLYRRHGTKAKLVVAALEHCLRETPLALVAASDDARADLLAICEAYAATVEKYGAAVTTLLDEVSLHRELRAALVVLRRNLGNAAGIVARHQATGQLTPGDPLQKLVFLVAPLMAMGIWERAKVGALTPALTPAAAVEAFLHGHGAVPGAEKRRGRVRGRPLAPPRRTGSAGERLPGPRGRPLPG